MPEPAGVERAEAVIALLEQWGVRPPTIRLPVNQTSPAMTLDLPLIAQQAGREVGVFVSAAPEACFEAARRRVPLVDLAPDLPAVRALRVLPTVSPVPAGAVG